MNFKKILKSILIVLVLSAFAYAQDEEVSSGDSGAAAEDDFDSFDDSGNAGDNAPAEDLSAEEEVEDEMDESEQTAEETAPEDELEPVALPKTDTKQTLEVESEPVDDLSIDDTVDQNAFTETSAGTDSPDLSYESKLHDIFMNFHSSRTSEDEWRSLVGNRNVESYGIQKGDNLWNISKTFFGDGNYWPKVWSLNSRIENPHLITQNNTIRFILGTESEPPAFTVTENQATQAAPSSPSGSDDTMSEPVTTSLDEGLPEIPPPLKSSRPVLRKVPPSLPEWQDIAGATAYDDSGIDYGKRKIVSISDTVPLPGYISEKPAETIGQILEIEVGHNIASAFQYIYVAMKKGVGDVGSTYLVLMNKGKVIPVNKDVDGRGYHIEVQGEIQLVERVKGRDDAEDLDVYRALVLAIVNPVTVGAAITEGRIERINVEEKGPRNQTVAEIIGGVFFNKRQIYGTEAVAFLNRGENDGLRVGQILPIRANLAMRNENTLVASNIRPIGWLKIVKSEPTVATAVVVRAWSDVITGDITGSGDLLSSAENVIDKNADAGNTSLTDELDEGDDFGEGMDTFDTEGGGADSGDDVDDFENFDE